jgi:hypothetical protein
MLTYDDDDGDDQDRAADLIYLYRTPERRPFARARTYAEAMAVLEEHLSVWRATRVRSERAPLPRFTLSHLPRRIF